MDKYKKVENLLSNYNMLKISIDNMKKDIEHLNKECGVNGISFDEVGTSPTNNISSVVENTVLSISEEKEELNIKIEDNKRKIDSVDRALEGLTEVERTILEEKYICSRQWWEVAGIVKYGERHCKRIRTAAINKMVVGIYGSK